MDEAARIVDADEVAEGETLLFTLRDDEGEPAEAFCTRLSDGAIVAYRNYCQHWTDVRLDKGDGARVTNGEVWCQRHGATFQLDTGYCDFGPCEGSVMESVDVVVADGGVFLDDDGYTFDHLGEHEGEGDEEGGSDGGGRIDFTGS
ncbi:Rieske 2Fe-2S domain-containing protein [Halobaculum sp. CBA1158]|uniref:Rieske (2Fe-2S) protein n=1 Tax=Halobaculum sp. CBA1158 TaxID=2904243 RepID=UPI001F2668C1|nr:Rieske 2Fe-2S domain-containing protein [Halobaculum sp. CBA1158]UIP00209.1 Rieske 2Fe-2S domain-containing protein [Halobaculum sp. CBA1158]